MLKSFVNQSLHLLGSISILSISNCFTFGFVANILYHQLKVPSQIVGTRNLLPSGEKDWLEDCSESIKPIWSIQFDSLRFIWIFRGSPGILAFWNIWHSILCLFVMFSFFLFFFNLYLVHTEHSGCSNDSY